MAVLANTNPTLADVAKALDPDGSVAKIVEILNQTNEILLDMTWVEGNLPTGMRHTIRSGIPEPTWRRLYEAVQPVRSTTVQVTDNCGMMENYGEIDKALADLSGNSPAFRFSQDRPIMEGFNQGLTKTLFYANEGTEPAKFMGFSPRFNSLSAPNADNIIDAGGSGSDNTSIWLVVWGEETVQGIYPKGSKAGLQHRDLGEQTKESASGLMQVLRSHFRWDCGVAVKDWRYMVRICNIDFSDLKKDWTIGGSDLVDLMIQAAERIPGLGLGRPAFYCSRDVRTFLRRQIKNAKNVNLSIETVGGKRVLAFDDIPVRRCDQLLHTEALVT